MTKRGWQDKEEGRWGMEGKGSTFASLVLVRPEADLNLDGRDGVHLQQTTSYYEGRGGNGEALAYLVRAPERVRPALAHADVIKKTLLDQPSESADRVLDRDLRVHARALEQVQLLRAL